ncbi:MAG TPA: RNA-binding cell elongation regulator Jag/EloR [Clostridia bacterium]|jgi:spoIIIJ-associated protein|nr:protein jag [Clostridiaceae bacterium]HOF26289.1 RNA-binding cell elongation regulator Jag/EloR [Clostridia bacterium]HOM35235.1 RNA-binding cell elongation regulator Jag/EloR [Clostridia bacterium]HOR89535.1 RNA-binding cell elongation regulator Jag/EloR [Clostridia bacterium]HOT70059.1 RNA-binding cell elongation regulator Jag/EloR [Clostridia bacterium]
MSRVSIEKTGKTVDEAVQAALLELGLELGDVEIEIVEEETKGLLGLGRKEAKVRVYFSTEDDPKETIKFFLEDILSQMNLVPDVFVSEEDGFYKAEISCNDSGLIIGRKGEVLQALQFITSQVVSRAYDTYIRVIIDTENYRERHKAYLEELARKTADKVVKAKRDFMLDPMSSYDRRIIHTCLQDRENVSTYSIGDEPYRKIVISFERDGKRNSY